MKNLLTWSLVYNICFFIWQPGYTQDAIMTCPKHAEFSTKNAIAQVSVGRVWWAQVTHLVGVDQIRVKATLKSKKKKSRWYLFGIKTRTKISGDFKMTVIYTLNNPNPDFVSFQYKFLLPKAQTK